MVYTAYTHAGKRAADNESISHYGSLLAFFSIKNSNIAKEIYNDKIVSQAFVDRQGYYWGDKNNSTDQYVSWLGVLIYFDKIPSTFKN